MYTGVEMKITNRELFFSNKALIEYKWNAVLLQGTLYFSIIEFTLPYTIPCYILLHYPLIYPYYTHLRTVLQSPRILTTNSTPFLIWIIFSPFQKYWVYPNFWSIVDHFEFQDLPFLFKNSIVIQILCLTILFYFLI